MYPHAKYAIAHLVPPLIMHVVKNVLMHRVSEVLVDILVCVCFVLFCGLAILSVSVCWL